MQTDQIAAKSSAQEMRLRNLITEKYAAVGGWIEEETLYVGEQKIALAPVLSVFENIQKSKEFTLLPSLFDSRENFPIADMYVELSVTSAPTLAGPTRLVAGLTLSEELNVKHQLQRSKRVSIQQAVSSPNHRNIVILGDPGSGKTSLMRYVALQIAQGDSTRWIIPIYISLRQYWREKQNCKSYGENLTLTRYAAAKLVNEQKRNFTSQEYTLFVPSIQKTKSEFIQKAHQQFDEVEHVLAMLSGSTRENVLFLLDGFDELASQQNAVDTLNEEIRQLSHGYAWVLTSRHTGFSGGLAEDIRYEVIALHNQGIEDLVTNWFNHIDSPDSTDNKNRILSQIPANPRLHTMARNPFLLTLLCYIQHRTSHLLPIQRSEIYAEIISLIRSQLRFQKKDDKLFSIATYNFVQRFCHYLYLEANGAPKQLFDRDDWDSCPWPNDRPSLDRNLLDARLVAHWRDDSDYHFVHLTFQEYFIALHLASLESFEAVQPHLYKPHWRMVFRFLAGIYWKSSQKELFIKLLKAFVDPPDLAGLLYVEAAWILVEAGMEDSTAILEYDLREKLWDIIVEGRPYIKDAAGEALAVLSPQYICDKFEVENLELRANSEERGSLSLRREFFRTGSKLPSKDIHTDIISLLGKAGTEEADELLISLFFDETDDLSVTASVTVSALAERNTPDMRKTLLERANENPGLYMRRISRLATAMQHEDFIPFLIERFKTESQKEDSLLSYVLVTMASIGSPNTESLLREFIESNPPLEFQFEALEAYATIASDSVKQWFVKHLRIGENFCHEVLIIGIAHDFIPPMLILEALPQANKIHEQAYIEALGDRADIGAAIDHRITKYLAGIAFSEDENSVEALQALTNIDRQILNSDKGSIPHLKQYRSVLDEEDTSTIKYALSVLGSTKDPISYNKILEIALHHDNDDCRVSAIQTLVNYSDTHKAELIEILRELVNTSIDENNSILEASLDALTQIELDTVKDYLHLPIAKHVITLACSEQGILLFEDGYIDQEGIKHQWDYQQRKCPKIDSNTSAYEQQDVLREICQYLLDNGLAAKASKIGEGKQTPLFRKKYDDAKMHAESIDIKTGNKFLRGDIITEKSAITLMQWLDKNFEI